MSRRTEIRTVAVAAKPHPDSSRVVKGVVERILSGGLRLRMDREAARSAGREPGLPRPEAVADCDLVVCVGGDGTLLSVARAVGAAGTPILGINLGSLGFLTETSIEDAQRSLEEALAGRAVVEQRMVLEVERSEGQGWAAAGSALNDLVVSKAAPVRLLRLSLRVGEIPVSEYRADGLLVGTPTGSTAYSLSAGGPILDPSMEALLVTPICPHTLTNRPLVVPAEASVVVTLSGGAEEAFATLDGQVGFPLRPGEGLRVRRADHRVALVRPRGHSFYGTLREKMGWGNP